MIGVPLTTFINQLTFCIMSKSNYDVAHEFAYGATERHTGNWNLYISGDCIYSYGSHFCIAKRVGKGAVLMTTRDYSNSTARHISYVKGATWHLDHIYCYDPNASHEKNQEHFLKEIKDLLPSLAKARKPEKWIHQIQVICARAEKYCEFFGIKMDKDLKKFVQSEDVVKTNEKYLQELQLKAKREARARLKKQREALMKWHNFEGRAPFLEHQELRLNVENKNRIETTMGVTITYDMGKEFYEKLKSGELKVGDSLLYYRVGKVDEKEVHVGCHRFKRKYLMDFGAQCFC